LTAPPVDISSGHAGLDAFLATGFDRIRGFSSRFSAAVCGHLMGRQTALGVTGDMIEIGAFEGRFFAALGLMMTPGELALGIDTFSWPDAATETRFLKNCADAGLPDGRYASWKVDSRAIAPGELRARLPSGAARFVHIDGEHSDECLRHDLELAQAVLHPEGIIALDDMLHPGYPALIVTVIEFLTRHPHMRLLCIVDRESITAAAKFLICRAERVAALEAELMQTFSAFHYIMGAHFLGRLTLVLTPDPRLPDIG
jgi:hypothetical protein